MRTNIRPQLAFGGIDFWLLATNRLEKALFSECEGPPFCLSQRRTSFVFVVVAIAVPVTLVFVAVVVAVVVVDSMFTE